MGAENNISQDNRSFVEKRKVANQDNKNVVTKAEKVNTIGSYVAKRKVTTKIEGIMWQKHNLKTSIVSMVATHANDYRSHD